MIIRPTQGGSDVTIKVNGREPQGGPISGRLFGNFLEHLGFSTQGGILAQALNNPTMTMDENMPVRVRTNMVRNGAILEQAARMGEGRARGAFGEMGFHRGGSGFSVAVMDDMRDLGIPFPWKAEPVIYAKGGQKGRVGNSVSLAPHDCEVALTQGVFLSQHRVLTYEGYVWVRKGLQLADDGRAADNANIGLAVRLARRTGEILAVRELGYPACDWTKLSFSLTLPEGVLAKGEPVDFQIVASGRGELFVDRACLFPADHVRGFDPEFLELTRKYAPPILRGPGGNFVSGYHFWHGIGDPDYRQTFKNPAWHGIETNFFGPDEFMSLCELIGSEPHVVINLGDGIPEEAAAWVEYMNGAASTAWGAKRAANGHPEPYGVRVWELGNEVYGEWQVGNCGDAEYARRYRETAKAMLAADPSIELIANGSEFDFYENCLNWNRTLMKEGGDTLDCISLHALPGNQEYGEVKTLGELWMILQAQPARWEKIDLPNLLDSSKELCPDRDISVAITEWGILGDGPLSPGVVNSGDSIYGACFYNMCMRLKEHIKVTNATALYHGGCLVKFGVNCYVDPQMEVIRRYTEFAGGTLYPVEYAGPVYGFKRGLRVVPPTSDIPAMDAACVKTVDGRVVVALVNRHHDERYLAEIIMDGFGSPAGAPKLVSCEMQQGTGMDDKNTPFAPDNVAFKPHGATACENSFKTEAPPRSVIFMTFG